MEYKVSDYIVQTLIDNKVKDVFGYPGGMITHLMDSLDINKSKINSHLCYHEQAAAFAACSNAVVSNNIGVAYATSGPGATNLITGIAQAYFDSVPVLFITGQVKTLELKSDLKVRQKGFQETDIVSIVGKITKYSVRLETAKDIRYELNKAIDIAKSGRPGPVLLDIPEDILKTVLNINDLRDYEVEDKVIDIDYKLIEKELRKAKRPVIVAGNGINIAGVRKEFREFVRTAKIPVVTSMIAIDLLEKSNKYNFGFIGVYGSRYANFMVTNCDLILSIGSRLDIRQTGSKVEAFAPLAKLIKLEIDLDEIDNKLKDDEIIIKCNLKDFFSKKLNIKKDYSPWLKICNKYKEELSSMDYNLPNELIRDISNHIPDNLVITTDVGQNQVWVSQSFENKKNQRVLYSGGHGSMGYSLPAAIGAYYASRRPVISFSGDGGFQMNLQELQLIVRENIPIKIIIMNNHSLGMIRHSQEMYLNSKFVQSTEETGYSSPNFCKIAKAYGIKSINIKTIKDINKIQKYIDSDYPVLINVEIKEHTYIYPKLSTNNPIDDQDPLIDRDLYNKLKKL